MMKWIVFKGMKLLIKLYFAMNDGLYCVHIGDKNPYIDYSVHKHTYPN